MRRSRSSFPSAFLVLLCASLLILAGCSTAAATTTVYVSPSGDDGADGSPQHPWRTVNRALGAARPGTTVRLAPGRYSPFVVTRSGTPTSPLVIAGAGARTPSLVEGVPGRPVVVGLEAVHDIVVRNLVIEGAPEQWGAGIRTRRSARITLDRLTLRHNRSFGALVEDSTAILLRDSLLTRNETGVQISRAGGGVRVVHNRIIRNDRMIVDDATPGNDRGANAIVFYKTTGAILVSGNRIRGNRAPSHDYRHDGGAFEIYGASNLTITRNVVWDNENVMETGTDGSLPCANNRFTRNVAYGGNGPGPAMGLILRCATGMLVARNTLYDLDRFAIDITAKAKAFGGSIEGLTVRRNILTSGHDHPLSIDSPLPASVSIDHDLLFNHGGGAMAYVAGRGNTRRLEDLTSWTGAEANGRVAAPQFAGAARGDLRPLAGSPAAGVGALPAVPAA